MAPAPCSSSTLGRGAHARRVRDSRCPPPSGSSPASPTSGPDDSLRRGHGRTAHLMSSANSTVLGIDWHVELDEGRRRVGGRPVQGELDPARCLGRRDTAVQGAREVLVEPVVAPGHIFNLGHGVLPSAIPRRRAVVRVVHEEGRACVFVTMGVLVMLAYDGDIARTRSHAPQTGDCTRTQRHVGPADSHASDDAGWRAWQRRAAGSATRPGGLDVRFVRVRSRRSGRRTPSRFANDGQLTWSWSWSSTPHSSSMSTDQYNVAGQSGVSGRCPVPRLGAWWRSRASLRSCGSGE